MSKRLISVLVVVGTIPVLAGTPAVAVRPPLATISSIDMVQISNQPWADCGVELSATFENVGRGRYWALFGIHTTRSGSPTQLQSHRLTMGQTSASFRLGSGSDDGDTFDYGEVTLYRGGRALDYEKVVKTIACPPSP